MSIRTRLALVLAAIVVFAMLLAGLGTAFAASGSVSSTLDRALTRQVEQLRRSPDAVDALRLLSSDGRGPGNRNGGLARDDQLEQLILPDGSVRSLFRSDTLPVDDSDRALLDVPGGSQIRTIELDSRPWRMITANIELNGRSGAIQIARANDDFADLRQGILRTTLISGVVASLLAALGGWLFSRRLTAPIEELTATTERVSSTQDLSERIEVVSGDEVGRLSTSFNSMLDALQSSRQQQHQLVQDANHELRTPLTSLRTNIEVIRRNADLEPTMRQQIMDDIESELGELTMLVEELVASATDTSQETSLEQVDLAVVAGEVADRVERRTGTGIDLVINPDNTQPPPDTTVYASRTQLERAMTNMANNAIKFGPPGTAVRLTVRGTEVTVDDDGPGIDPVDRDRVFQRFYRATAARSVSGSGLGLAIVAQVAESHGGRYWAAESPLGGAQVGFTISAGRPEPD